jgi:RNA polymerase sigma factor (sigma-70 family)
MRLTLDDATARWIVDVATRAASWNKKIYGPLPAPHDSQSIAQEVVIEVLEDRDARDSCDSADQKGLSATLTIIRLTKRVLRRARERPRLEQRRDEAQTRGVKQEQPGGEGRQRCRKRLPPDVSLSDERAATIPEDEGDKARRRVELAIDLKEILATMDDSTQAVLWMSYSEELSAREIALKTGLPGKTVYRIRSEGLAKLARRLG